MANSPEVNQQPIAEQEGRPPITEEMIRATYQDRELNDADVAAATELANIPFYRAVTEALNDIFTDRYPRGKRNKEQFSAGADRLRHSVLAKLGILDTYTNIQEMIAFGAVIKAYNDEGPKLQQISK